MELLENKTSIPDRIKPTGEMLSNTSQINHFCLFFSFAYSTSSIPGTIVHAKVIHVLSNTNKKTRREISGRKTKVSLKRN